MRLSFLELPLNPRDKGCRMTKRKRGGYMYCT